MFHFSLFSVDCNSTRKELAPFNSFMQKITRDMLEAIKNKKRSLTEPNIAAKSFDQGEQEFLKLIFIQGRNNVSDVSRLNLYFYFC